MKEQDFLNEISNKMANDLANKFDEIFEEGLRLKGFEFNNKFQLYDFVKHNCSCLEDSENFNRTFTVNGMPFLFHSYRQNVTPVIEINGEFSISADFGYYKYL